MLKRLTTALLFFLFLSHLFAQIPTGYYANADGKSGAYLKTALYDIIKNPSVTSYGGLYTSFLTTDKKANGKVWDMYSDIPGGTPPYEYSYGSGTCGNYAKEGDCYNREHSFPQSWFNSSSPMQSDLFHLYPTDGKVNGIRSNYPYGEVGTASTTSQNGSKLGASKSPGYSSIVFEPIDEYKGDLARSVLYMVTCYENQVVAWQGNGNADNILAGNTFPALDQWHIDLLAKWHQQDPVSTKEINRNNAAYAVQGNRNPFIDRPEYAGLIWGFGTTSGVNTNTCTGISPTTQLSNINISAISQNSASISWTNGNGKGRLVKLNNTNTFSNPTDNANLVGNAAYISGEQNVYSGVGHSVVVTGLNTLTTYYIKGYEYDCTTGTGFIYNNNPSTNNPSSFATLSVPSAPTDGSNGTIIVNQNFTPCPAVGWQTILVTGTKNWFCNAGGFMECNGFINASSTPAQEAWLISPAFDTRSFTGLTFSFKSATRYTDNTIVHPQITVYYATNYAWLSSGLVTVNGISSANVYFAYRYKSSGSGSNSSTRWRIDDVLINGLSSITGLPPATANNAPTALNLTLSGLASDTLKGSLINSISDIDLDKILITIQNEETTAKFGTVSIFEDGSIAYKSTALFTGIDFFEYTVCDPTTCTSGIIYFDVKYVNKAPIAKSDTFIVAKNLAFSGSINDLYSDLNNDVLTLQSFIGTLAGGSNFLLNANGSFTFIPKPSFVGLETYTYKVCDQDSCSFGKLNFSIAGITNSMEKFADNFKLYPQPVSDILIISSNKTIIKSIALYNLLGEKIDVQAVDNSTSVVIDVSHLNAGCYVLMIESENFIFAKQVLIVK